MFRNAMAQGPERWASKILGLPIFSDAFAKAVQSSPFGNLAMVLAMDVQTPQEFAVQVADWAPQFSEDFRDDLLRSPFMLEQFYVLVRSVEQKFLASTALQLGFGCCESIPAALDPNAARAKRVGAIRALTEKTAPPKKAPKVDPHAESSTPLLDQENAARWKYAARLEEIGKRAGSFSKLLLETTNESGLSAEEMARLRHLVLASGAPRTMAVHISNWERFEDWIVSTESEIYPITEAKLLQYAMFLDRNECGPSVIPTFRTSVRWITNKLAIECPAVDHPALLALQADVITRRAKALKEAVPIPTPVIACMEKLVADQSEPAAARLFVWWWLCMVFASLRYDDALHVRPNELSMNEEGLFGVAWQTKVERKRRGTKFVVPHVSFSGLDWLREGWSLMQQQDLNRDYWMADLNAREEFNQYPATYNRSVLWLKWWARYSVNHFHSGPELEFKELAAHINKLTAHSARVTLLDAAVHAGRSTEEIGLQANWKNPGPLVLKYTRNRSSIPAQMVQQLVKDMLVEQHPAQPAEDEVLEESDPTAYDQFQFFVKTSAAARWDYRYHCSSVQDEELTACGRVSVSECDHMGSDLPDVSMLCKQCGRARPEVVEAFTVKR